MRNDVKGFCFRIYLWLEKLLNPICTDYVIELSGVHSMLTALAFITLANELSKVLIIFCVVF